MRRLLLLVLIIICKISYAQQYTATDGLIHVPSADMDSAGNARLGIHYMPKYMMPESMTVDGEKFNSAAYYLSITPFKWIQFGVVEVLWKCHKRKDPDEHIGFYGHDRHFSVKIRPMEEGQYWPSVVFGSDDLYGCKDDGDSDSFFFRNYYISASKHFLIWNNQIGTHITYRKWKRDYNKKWNGLVGGVTLNPYFHKPLRFICEWDGSEINVGADYRLLNLFLLQLSLINGKYLTGGLCLSIDLM